MEKRDIKKEKRETNKYIYRDRREKHRKREALCLHRDYYSFSSGDPQKANFSVCTSEPTTHTQKTVRTPEHESAPTGPILYPDPIVVI